MYFVQSNYGTKGNFEAVFREAGRLVHYWRNNDDPEVLPWYRGPTFGTNVASEPALLHSTFGNQGNFEVVVREGKRLRHYWRENDVAGYPWHKGALFGSSVSSAPAMIQSNYGNQGNFEVVVREGRKLRHYWRDNDAAGFPWHRGALFGSNAFHAPALIQSNFGYFGNFELVVPERSGTSMRLRHYWRDNDAGMTWHKGRLFGPRRVTSAPTLIQSNFGYYGNFEVVVRDQQRLCHYWRDNDANGYPWRLGVRFSDHISYAPSLIQGNFGLKGNFELLTRRGKCWVHYWRDNQASGYPWSDEIHLHAVAPLGSDPTPAKRSQFVGYFPRLRSWKVTAPATGAYNCIAWSVGVTSQWIWPGNTVAVFDQFYGSYGWTPSASGRREYKKRKVALWADSSGCTHGSPVTYDCEWNESKCGGLERIMHDKYQMQGGAYGDIIKYYEKADPGANLDLA